MKFLFSTSPQSDDHVCNDCNIADEYNHNALKSKQSGVWYYQFNWDKGPAPWNDVYGAAHAFDLPFLFGNFGPSLFGNVIGGNANKGGRLALSNAMMKSLAAFARNGDPNDPVLGVTWPAWSKKLVFDATLTDKSVSVP